MSGPASCALEVRGLVLGYGARRVLDQVSFEARPGELWAVLGPNGAGKSTLLKACLGLLPAWQGEVRLGGRALAEWTRRELAQQVAWVPQAVDEAVEFTGLELVLMGRSPHLGLWGVPSDADAARGLAVLESLQLAHLADRRCGTLSGGERRMLLLARSLVQQSPLLLLDEPTAFLDLRHQVEALAAVRDFTRRGNAAVAVLHDVNLAAAFADRVLLLSGGKVAGQGPAAQLLTSDRLEALFGVRMAVGESGGQRLFAPRPEPRP